MSDLVLDPVRLQEELARIPSGTIGAIHEILNTEQVTEFGQWAIASVDLRPLSISGLPFGNGLQGEGEYSPGVSYNTTPDPLLKNFSQQLYEHFPVSGGLSTERLRRYGKTPLPALPHTDQHTRDLRFVIPTWGCGSLVHSRPTSLGRSIIGKYDLSIGDIGVINNLCPRKRRAPHYTLAKDGVLWLIVGRNDSHRRN